MTDESPIRALVTGCCGFIGSHLVATLLEAGWIVDGVDDMSGGSLDNVGHLRDHWKVRVVPIMLAPAFEHAHESDRTQRTLLVFEGDFCAPVLFNRIVKKQYDVIFHLAAEPSVEISITNPAATAFNNLQKTIELMAVSVGVVRRFVFASSAAVYGNVPPSLLPITEKTPPSPISPYALQKIQVEETGRLFRNLYGLDFVALRMFNVYGPRQDGNSPYSTVVAAWCNKIKQGLPLRLDGDGQQSRDLIYITDVCNMFRAVGESRQHLSFTVANVATGIARTNNSILDLLRQRWPEIEVENAPTRKGDVKLSVADVRDVEKKRSILKISEKTTFVEGLDLTLKSWGLIGE